MKIELQREYCNRKNLPMFLENDAKCHNCKGIITDDYTEYECGNMMITYCKKCNKSLLD